MQIKILHLSSSIQNSPVIDESKSSLLLFDIVSTTFIPGMLLSEKGVEVLRSIENLGRFTVSVYILKRGSFETERKEDD
jgi:hypothetical protein